MKRFSILALILLCTGTLYVISCQKDNSLSSPTDAPSTVTTAVSTDVVSDRGPLILGTVSTYCSCIQGRTCSAWAYYTTKRNGIKVVLNPVTHTFYNVNGTGLRYRIYKANTCGNAADLVADFICNQSTVQYANSNLPNTGSYSVVISYLSSSSGCYTVPAGTCNGQFCNIDEKN